MTQRSGPPTPLSREQLDGLWAATVGESGLFVATPTLRALIQQARFGIGLATIQAKPFKQLSAAGRKAANARWDRHRAAARKRTEAGDSCDSA